jgi:hypothetical protein
MRFTLLEDKLIGLRTGKAATVSKVRAYAAMQPIREVVRGVVILGKS